MHLWPEEPPIQPTEVVITASWTAIATTGEAPATGGTASPGVASRTNSTSPAAYTVNLVEKDPRFGTPCTAMRDSSLLTSKSVYLLRPSVTCAKTTAPEELISELPHRDEDVNCGNYVFDNRQLGQDTLFRCEIAGSQSWERNVIARGCLAAATSVEVAQ